MRTTIDMAREAGYMRTVHGGAEISMASMDCLKAFEALVRADERALATPVQEPVAFEAFNAWMHDNLPVGTVIGHSGWWAGKIYDRFIKNTTPPAAQRQWVGLTDEEAKKAFAEHNCDISKDLAGILARAIEAKLKEKNT